MRRCCKKLLLLLAVKTVYPPSKSSRLYFAYFTYALRIAYFIMRILQLTDSQGAMAMALCNYVVRRPSSTEVGLACRMLALLSPPRDGQLASELANMLRDLCLVGTELQAFRSTFNEIAEYIR